MKRERGLAKGLTSTAFIRAVESRQPADRRLFVDGCSDIILPNSWRMLLLPGLRHAMLALSELRDAGAAANLLCRTRYIDDALNQALEQAVDQVVVLGAGFDLRPYRVPGIERTRVFEVDRPAAQEIKRVRLERRLGKLPEHVAFVPVDFDRQQLGPGLVKARFRTGARTFFIWEGVTQSLTAQKVDATLRFVASTSLAGSQIVFTYIHRGIIDGYARSKSDEKVLSLARKDGVPWIFGLDPSDVEGYLVERHLDLVEEVWAPVYRKRYLEPCGREMRVFEGERVVLAQVSANHRKPNR